MKKRARSPGGLREVCIELGFAPTHFSASTSLGIDPLFCGPHSLRFLDCIALPRSVSTFLRADSFFCTDFYRAYRPPRPTRNRANQDSLTALRAQFECNLSSRSQKRVKLAPVEPSSRSVIVRRELDSGHGWAQFHTRQSENGQTGSR